jgi:hypothetical protein
MASNERFVWTKSSDPVASFNFFGRFSARHPTIGADENHSWAMEKAEPHCCDLKRAIAAEPLIKTSPYIFQANIAPDTALARSRQFCLPSAAPSSLWKSVPSVSPNRACASGAPPRAPRRRQLISEVPQTEPRSYGSFAM